MSKLLRMGTSAGLRELVSKKKIRFKEDGYDLDLTYVTERIIAMGFPSEGTESLYRNPMDQVQKLFNERHKGYIRVYNLCKERTYPSSRFDSTCHMGFQDHNPATLSTIINFCDDAKKFLEKNEKNVIAVHCKAGKGRTGLMISCLLIFLGICKTPEDALDYFGNHRTSNGKGVTIPSQQRYVHYFANYIKLKSEGENPDIEYAVRHLTNIRFYTVPNFDIGGGCDPYYEVARYYDGKLQTIYQSKKHSKTHKYKGKGNVDLPCDLDLEGDVKFTFYDEDRLNSDDKMFWCWFNVSMIKGNTFKITKYQCDGAHKQNKKCFHENFACEFTFSEAKETKARRGSAMIKPRTVKRKQKNNLTFYYSPCSIAEVTLAVLECLGVEHIRIDVEVGVETSYSEFKNISPMGKIPVIIHNGTSIWESSAITMYLGETYGVAKGLYPPLGTRRGEAMKWIVWTGTTLSVAAATMAAHLLPTSGAEFNESFRGALSSTRMSESSSRLSLSGISPRSSEFVEAKERDSKVYARAKAEVERAVGILDKALQESIWLLEGEHHSLVDVHVQAFVLWLKELGIDLEGYKHVSKWLTQLKTRAVSKTNEIDTKGKHEDDDDDEPPPPPPPPELPEGWTSHVAPDGRTYYYNAKTKKSVWNLPE